MFNKLKQEDIIYLAGFIDGDGNILAQIVKKPNYKLKFQITVSITIFQKSSRLWFLEQIFNLLQIGSIRNRPNNISEFTIIGNPPIKKFLTILLPYLKIKKSIANLIITIIDHSVIVKNRNDFLEVCKLVDKVAELTESKERKITTDYVKSYYENNPE